MILSLDSGKKKECFKFLCADVILYFTDIYFWELTNFNPWLTFTLQSTEIPRWFWLHLGLLSCFFLPCVREEDGQLWYWNLLNVMINTFKSSPTNDYGFHTLTNCFNFWLKWKSSTCFSIVAWISQENITNIIKVSFTVHLSLFS